MSDPSYVNTVPTVRLRGVEDERFAVALLSLSIGLSTEGMDHAEVALVDWGADGSGDVDRVFQDVKLGDALELECGGKTTATVFRGEITAIEERWGEGAQQLVLLAEDALHRLARIRKSRSFEKRTLDEVIGELARDAGLTADASTGVGSATWHQLNESDLAFLRRLVDPLGLSIRLDGTTLRVRPFAPTGEPVDVDVRLGAHRARLLADLNHQYTLVEACGHDLASGEDVRERKDSPEPAPQGEWGGGTARALGWRSEARITSPFPLDRARSGAYVKGALRRRALGFVRGELELEGDPSIAPGREVRVLGASPRFEGTWFVGRARHTFDRDVGYRTHAEIARGEWTP